MGGIFDVFDVFCWFLAGGAGIASLWQELRIAVSEEGDDCQAFGMSERDGCLMEVFCILVLAGWEILVFLTIAYLSDYQWNGAVFYAIVNSVKWKKVYSKFYK